MKKIVLAGIFLLGGVLVLSGCGKNKIDLDKTTTVAFDPAKDQPLEPAGGPGGKSGGPAMGKKGKGAAPAGQ